MTKTRSFGVLALAAAVTGALAAAGTASAADVTMEKCYGVAKPGENGCAHAKGLHSCAGNSTFTNDGGDWKVVPTGTCVKMKGSLTPFVGTNPDKKV